ncbi:MAG TPA: DUF2239 family protein [Caulobacteraceae bacterium]|jgi:hypothetical protein
MTSTPTPEAGAPPKIFIAFEGPLRLARGALAEAAVAAWRAHQRGSQTPVLVFDGETGAVVDLDLRGHEADVAARYAPAQHCVPTRGRPKLGVTAREVTLLPRHWDWLARQPGGASAALRRLVDAARSAEGDAGRERVAREAAYRFMVAMGGDLPGFEAAARSLFAGDLDKLRASLAGWPEDIRNETLRFASLDPLLG